MLWQLDISFPELGTNVKSSTQKYTVSPQKMDKSGGSNQLSHNPNEYV